VRVDKTNENIGLSVIVPAFNEAERLGPTIERLIEYLAPRHESGSGVEVLIVDDGSTDGTAAVAIRAAQGVDWVRCLSYPVNRGKGYAVRRGMQVARGARRLFSDADLSAPIEELPKLETCLDAGADIAIGSRAVDETLLEVRQPWYRQTMGRTFNKLIQLVGLTEFGDTQCGFKLFTARAAEDLFGEASVDGFAFDVEILMLARGVYTVKEVAVRWSHKEDSRVAIGIEPLRMLLQIGRIRVRRHFFGR
jgi:dolichyl-phosphate beta-glucosyltransferase